MFRFSSPHRYCAREASGASPWCARQFAPDRVGMSDTAFMIGSILRRQTNGVAIKMILAGDVGGTKTLLEIGSLQDGRWRPVYAARYAAAGYADLHAVLHEFFADCATRHIGSGALTAACFGVAGPAFDNCVRMTNLPWLVDAAAIAGAFGIPRVQVVNDFAAAAAGVELLGAADLQVLQPGEPLARAPRLVIGAGTGLGVAQLIFDGEGYRVIAGEAGHATFAPANLQQLELCRELLARGSRVTSEDLVSGPGLVRIYEFIRRGAGTAAARAAPTMIVEDALARGDATSLRALDLFIACYGEVAGNLALGILARGGVFIAGGIAPKILPRLLQGGFLDAFNAKAGYSDTMRKIPVSVILNERVGLLGCAALAAGMGTDIAAQTDKPDCR